MKPGSLLGNDSRIINTIDLTEFSKQESLPINEFSIGEYFFRKQVLRFIIA